MQTQQNEATRELKEYMDGFETISKFHTSSGIVYMFPAHINDIQFFKKDIINVIEDIDDGKSNFDDRANQHDDLSNPICVLRVIPINPGHSTYYNMFDIDIRDDTSTHLSSNVRRIAGKLQEEEYHIEQSRKIMEEFIDAMYQLKVLGYYWSY